jgi:hypothetical protein
LIPENEDYWVAGIMTERLRQELLLTSWQARNWRSFVMQMRTS